MPAITVLSYEDVTSHQDTGEVCRIYRGKRYDVCGDAAVIQKLEPSALPTDVDYGQALRRSYLELDSKHLASALDYGTTAVTAIFDGQKITTATVGDSCLFIVVRDEKGEPIYVERLNRITHKAKWESEKRRIEKQGGYVEYQRAMGLLAISRALGDRQDGYQGVVIAEPDIDEITIEKISEKFPGQIFTMEIFGCSDGLTDYLVKDSETYELEKKAHNEALSRLLETIYCEHGKLPYGFLVQEIFEKIAKSNVTDDVTIFIKKVDQTPFLVGVFDGHGLGNGLMALRASRIVAENIVEVFREECKHVKQLDVPILEGSVFAQDRASGMDEAPDIASLKEELLQVIISFLKEYNRNKTQLEKSTLISKFLEEQEFTTNSILNKLKQRWRDKEGFDWLPQGLEQTEDDLCKSADYYFIHSLLISSIKLLAKSNIFVYSQYLEEDLQRFRSFLKNGKPYLLDSAQAQIDTWVDEFIGSTPSEEFSSRYRGNDIRSTASAVSTHPDSRQINYNIYNVISFSSPQDFTTDSILAELLDSISSQKLREIFSDNILSDLFDEKSVLKDSLLAQWNELKQDYDSDRAREFCTSEEVCRSYLIYLSQLIKKDDISSIEARFKLFDIWEKTKRSPKEVLSSSQPTPIEVPKTMLKVIKGEGTDIEFTEKPVRGDGNCALSCLQHIKPDANRADIKAIVLSHRNNEKIREQFKSVLADALFSDAKSILTQQLLTQWRQLHANFAHEPEALYQFLERDDVFECYANYLGRDGAWLDISTILLYAETHKLAVSIWNEVAQDSPQDRRIKKMYASSAASNNPQGSALDMIVYFTRGHFNVLKPTRQLIECSIPSTASASAESSESQPSASASTVKVKVPETTPEVIIPENCKPYVTRAMNILKKRDIDTRFHEAVIKACCKYPTEIDTALKRLDSSDLLTEQTLLQVIQNDGREAKDNASQIIRMSQKVKYSSQSSAFFPEVKRVQEETLPSLDESKKCC